MSSLFSRKPTSLIGLRRYSNFLHPVPALHCQTAPPAATVTLAGKFPLHNVGPRRSSTKCPLASVVVPESDRRRTQKR